MCGERDSRSWRTYKKVKEGMLLEHHPGPEACNNQKDVYEGVKKPGVLNGPHSNDRWRKT